MDEIDLRLLAEQLSHMLDVVNGRFDTLEARMAHWEALAGLRLDGLESRQADQEQRLRAVNDAVVRLTTASGLAQAGQAVFALVLSAIAAYLGRR